MRVRFSWDPAKDKSNQGKHGIAFDLAAHVFADPFRLTRQDRIENGEMRWQTLGMVGAVTVLLVAHTVQDYDEYGAAVEEIRIISARRATPRERLHYEQENR